MAELKTKQTQASVDEYLDTIEDPRRRADCAAISGLMKKVTKCEPKMWGPTIVGFGSYHYRYETGREGDMPVAAFSPRKPGTVVYGLTGFDDSEALRKKPGKHTISGSCLHIKKLADVDQKVLETLVVKSVAATRARHPN
jgi:hypothetical protein